MMITQTEVIQKLVVEAVDKYAACGRIPRQDVPAVIDNNKSDVENSTALRGSIIRVSKDGSTKFYAVPAVGDAFQWTLHEIAGDGPSSPHIELYGAVVDAPWEQATVRFTTTAV